MDKLKLKEFLLSLERAHVNRAELNYEEYLAEIKQGWENIEDTDDHSHAVEGEEKTIQYKNQLVDHQNQLELIKSISFEPMTEVGLGAVVKVNENYLVVSAPEPKFKFDGKVFMGISVSAPIYANLRGKKVGEEFTLNGKKFRINEIH